MSPSDLPSLDAQMQKERLGPPQQEPPVVFCSCPRSREHPNGPFNPLCNVVKVWPKDACGYQFDYVCPRCKRKTSVQLKLEAAGVPSLYAELVKAAQMVVVAWNYTGEGEAASFETMSAAMQYLQGILAAAGVPSQPQNSTIKE